MSYICTYPRWIIKWNEYTCDPSTQSWHISYWVDEAYIHKRLNTVHHSCKMFKQAKADACCLEVQIHRVKM